MFRRFVFLNLAVLLLFAPATAAAQDDGGDIDALLAMAVEFLGQEIGVPLTTADVSRWTWEETFWPDAALGCPQPGFDYAQVVTRGYSFTLTVADTVYEVHLTPDGSARVLCGQNSAPAATAPQTESTAEAPTVLDADTLRDLAVAYINGQLGTDFTRENFTRWEWEQTTWPDASLGCPQPGEEYTAGNAIPGYIITLEQTGTLYELHVSADGRTIMPCNDPRFSPIIDGEPPVSPAEADVPDAAATLGAFSPDAAEAAILLYTGPDGNVRRATLDSFPGDTVVNDAVDVTGSGTVAPVFAPTYHHYRWSPDGTRTAFVDAAHPYRLLITDAAGNPPIVIADNLAAEYPPAWSPDGSTLAYVAQTQIFRGPGRVLEIYAVQPSPDGIVAEPRLLGEFVQTVGCGGGSDDPADQVYAAAAGFGGSAQFFAWLPGDAFLFTENCTGAGLARLDTASGATTIIDSGLARISLNPSRTQLAAIHLDGAQPPQVVIVDLRSGEQATLPMSGTPERVLWSADGQRLFVSTAEPADAPEGEPPITVYDVSLWEIDLETGASTLRFNQEGRGIAGIAEAVDGSGVIFTFIDSARSWQVIAANGGSIAEQRRAAPTPWLLLLTPDGEITRLGQGSHPALPTAIPAAQG